MKTKYDDLAIERLEWEIRTAIGGLRSLNPNHTFIKALDIVTTVSLMLDQQAQAERQSCAADTTPPPGS